jgi:hypothetical protein
MVKSLRNASSRLAGVKNLTNDGNINGWLFLGRPD